MRTLAIILACVVGPALIPIGIVVVMERRAEPLVRPPALVWGDRVFVSKAQFASWLEERGASYQEWVGRHPGASPWERRAALAAGPTRPATAAAKAASADRRAS